ncbi:MAG: acyltransferase family protein [Microthrixaceae bacterium]
MVSDINPRSTASADSRFAAIILYHSELGLAPGAFLSVSTFFTLSGFLITSVLLSEHDRSGRISLRNFWVRRLRRLLPAALVGITLISVTARVWGDSTQLARLRIDALSALGYAANWRFIVAGDSYGATFASPSPFTHFWTLAIEEQLYVVIPLLVVLALSAGAKRSDPLRRTCLLLGLVTAGGVVWSNVLIARGATVDRLYFGTDVRYGELLAGAVLAVWWHRRCARVACRTQAGRAGELDTAEMVPPDPPAWMRHAGTAALVAMVASWATADLRQMWFYRGGLLAYTALTCLVIVSAVQPGGLIRRLLAWRPLVWAGTVSYGAYLLHYPILLWLRQAGSLHPLPALALAVPLTFALAAVSARFIEGPIRSGRRIPVRRVPSTAVLAMGSTFALVLAVTAGIKPADRADFENALRWQRFLAATAAQNRSTAPRIAVFGDSTALMTSQGLQEWSREHPDEFVARGGWANLGCGLVDRGTRITKGAEAPVPTDCRDWERHWASAAAEHPADIAVIDVGPWEVTDQRPDPNGPLRVIGDPTLDRTLIQRLRTGIDTLRRNSRLVVVLNPPDIEMGRIDGRSPLRPFPESDPARMQRFRVLVAGVVADYDDPAVVIVDLARWLDSHDERSLRPDGVHFTDRTAVRVARWLGPTLTERYRRVTGRSTSAVKPR